MLSKNEVVDTLDQLQKHNYKDSKNRTNSIGGHARQVMDQTVGHLAKHSSIFYVN